MNNANDNFLLEFQELENLSIKDFLIRITQTAGKSLNELRIKDLSYHIEKPIQPGEGIYIFRIKKEIVYVGKASSMSFTERIPKHLDFRDKAWFNRLLVLICERHLEIQKNDKNLLVASKYAFDNLNLVMINFQSRDRISRTERLLRSCTNTLNRFKKLKESRLDKIVKEY